MRFKASVAPLSLSAIKKLFILCSNTFASHVLTLIVSPTPFVHIGGINRTIWPLAIGQLPNWADQPTKNRKNLPSRTLLYTCCMHKSKCANYVRLSVDLRLTAACNIQPSVAAQTRSGRGTQPFTDHVTRGIGSWAELTQRAGTAIKVICDRSSPAGGGICHAILQQLCAFTFFSLFCCCWCFVMCAFVSHLNWRHLNDCLCI